MTIYMIMQSPQSWMWYKPRWMTQTCRPHEILDWWVGTPHWPLLPQVGLGGETRKSDFSVSSVLLKNHHRYKDSLRTFKNPSTNTCL